MNTKFRQEKKPDGALRSLNTAIDALDLTRDNATLKPAKDSFHSASALLTTIRDSVIEKEGFVELGLVCAEICQSLDRGMKAGGVYHQPGPPVLEAIEQLTTSTVEIQRYIIKKGKRSAFSRPFSTNGNSEAMAAWKSNLDKIRRVVETELATTPGADDPTVLPNTSNTNAIISGPHDDLSKAGVPEDRLDVLKTGTVVTAVDHGSARPHKILSDKTADDHTAASDVHHRTTKSREDDGSRYRAPYASAPGESPPPPPKTVPGIHPELRHALSKIERKIDELLPTFVPTPSPSTAIDTSVKENIPGTYGRHDNRGYYAGPTSTASHLLMEGPRSRTVSEEAPGDQTLDANRDYDRDLIDFLPSFDIIDALLEYYFEYCNWVYRDVNQTAFLSAWQKFKGGRSSSRLTLATAAVLSGLAIRYLPPGHELLSSLSVAIPSESSYNELSTKYYDTMKTALQRYKDENNPYTLEFVELQLVRCHYLTFTKTRPEEIWYVRGELVTIGTAMGLHRDPGKSRYSRDTAERRKWAWWHIILLERWQAFVFGRPLAIASHHFNTQLPSYCPPEVDNTGRLYYPNIALFRLAFILGQIMEDSVSLRPVTYETFDRNDLSLVEWLETLPQEIDLDYPDLSQALMSPATSRRRVAVQSIITRTAFYHIRFTLHRPYAIGPDCEKTRESRKIAIDSAEKLLALAKQTSPGYLDSNAQESQAMLLSFRGHLNWLPFHLLSAGMFFTFQLIRNPNIPEASGFRQHLRTVFSLLENSGSMPVAEKSLHVLHNLAPLYSEEFYAMDERRRAEYKANILEIVGKLEFPYQSPPSRIKPNESPINFPIAFSRSESDRSGQTNSPVGQMKVESLLDPGPGNPSGPPPNQPTIQPPAMLPPSSSILVPPPDPPSDLQPISATYTQPCLQFDHNVAGPSTQTDVNIPYYTRKYEYLYGSMSVTRQPQAGWTPMVDTWGGGSGFPQNEWYLPFDGSGAHQQ